MNYCQAHKGAALYPCEDPQGNIHTAEKKAAVDAAPQSYLQNVGGGISPVAFVAPTDGKCAHLEIDIVCTQWRSFIPLCLAYSEANCVSPRYLK